MIATADLLAALGRRGVALELHAGDLRVVERVPGAYSDRLRSAVAHYRPAILAHLRPRTSPTCTGCGKHHFATPTRCFWCRQVPT